MSDEAMSGPVTPSSPAEGMPEATWAMLCHLSTLVAYIGVPFGNIIAPLIIWLVKKDEMPLVDDQGKEALNFQISMTIYLLASGLAMFVLVGFLLLPAVVIFALVFTVIAALKAKEGEQYRYPLTIRFLK